MKDNRIGKEVSLTMATGYWWRGIILEETELNLTIRDLKGERVELAKSGIMVCKEIAE
tara:strand:+ start:197 stop:370 length:174 start_codon:yes stop_codon:yes gene_type:complete